MTARFVDVGEVAEAVVRGHFRAAGCAHELTTWIRGGLVFLEHDGDFRGMRVTGCWSWPVPREADALTCLVLAVDRWRRALGCDS